MLFSASESDIELMQNTSPANPQIANSWYCAVMALTIAIAILEKYEDGDLN